MSALSNTNAQYVSRNLHDLRNLPDPDETWQYSDVDLSWRTFMQLTERNLVEQVEKYDEARSEAATWRTTRRLESAVERYAS